MSKEDQKSVVQWAGPVSSPDVLLVLLSQAYSRLVAAYVSGNAVDESAADMQIALWRMADALGFDLVDETSFRMFLLRQEP